MCDHVPAVSNMVIQCRTSLVSVCLRCMGHPYCSHLNVGSMCVNVPSPYDHHSNSLRLAARNPLHWILFWHMQLSVSCWVPKESAMSDYPICTHYPHTCLTSTRLASSALHFWNSSTGCGSTCRATDTWGALSMPKSCAHGIPQHRSSYK